MCISDHLVTFTMNPFQSSFDPKSYCDLYFKDPRKQNSFLLEKQHHFWSKVIDTKVNNLLEYGAGPTISRMISATCHVETIVAAEFLDANRKAIRDWITRESQAFDWRPSVQYVVQTLEGKKNASEEVDKREKELREKIKAIVPCDLRSNYLDIPNGLQVPPFDVVSTSLCIESVVKNDQEYENAVKYLAGLVRSGGYLTKIGTVGCTFYTVGDARFTNFPPSKELVVESMEKSGIQEVVYESSASRTCSILEEADESDLYDGQGFFFAYGKKR